MAVRFPLVPQKVFGASAGSNRIAKFGSLAANAPAYTTDPAQVQALSNWDQGWDGATIGNNSPAVEDVNGVDFLLSRQIAYLQQLGITEWSSTTTYYTGSVVQDGLGNMYCSIIDNNLNNALTTGNWQRVWTRTGVPGYKYDGSNDINIDSIGYSDGLAVPTNVPMTHASVVTIASIAMTEGYWAIDALVNMTLAGFSGYLISQQIGIAIGTSMTPGVNYWAESFSSQMVAGSLYSKKFSTDQIRVGKGVTYTYNLLGLSNFSSGSPGSSNYASIYTRLTRRKIG